MTATDDYFRYRASSFGKSAIVLDLGCGDGRFLEMLLDAGCNAIGVDVPDARSSIETRAALRPELDLLSHVTFFNDPERLPFSDNSVDVILSNTVFEHILTLNSTVAELARILKPGGRVYTVFPLASAIVEQHCGLPFMHGIESRKIRLFYIKTAKVLGLYRNRATPEEIERYIYEHVFYRRDNEMRLLFLSRFAQVESDVEAYITVKAESLLRHPSPVPRLLGRFLRSNAGRFAKLVHIRHSAAYCLAEPRKLWLS